jgi:methyltransferase (TIGR00027 family)
VAALRALHQWVDGTPTILDDPIAERLLDPGTRELLEADFARVERSAALRAHVVTRSRFAEDRLKAAVEHGVTQYVVLGSGFDTFGWRQPEWARPLRIFDVDEPVTQNDKRRRIAAAGLSQAGNLVFVPVDFHTGRLEDALAAAGFDRTRPGFFSWLGVTMYLDEAANEAVLRFVASLPRSSEIVFTFAPSSPDGAEPPDSRLEAMAAAAGERWRTRYDPAVLPARLSGLGYAAVWLPSPAEIASTYFLHRTRDLPLPRRRTIVSAVV